MHEFVHQFGLHQQSGIAFDICACSAAREMDSLELDYKFRIELDVVRQPTRVIAN